MFKKIKKFLPLTLGLVTVGAIIAASPREKIAGLLKHLDHRTLAALFLLGCTYYVSKAVRFWVMLKQLGINKPLSRVTLIYFAAQPVSLLPAGELYRAVLLEKHLEVKLSRSYPTVVMQGVIEGIVLLGFAVAAALTMATARVPVVIFSLLFVLFLVALQRNWIEKLHPYLNKIPFVDLKLDKIHDFVESHKTYLKRGNLIILVALSCIPIMAGILILWISAQTLGAHISFGAAILGYTLPVVLAGLSFLPGGLGASEGSTIGLLKLVGTTTSAAFAITLLVRIFTLGVGLGLGAAALAFVHLGWKQP